MNSEFGGLLNNLPKAPEAKPTASHRADSASSSSKKSTNPSDPKGFENLLTNKAAEKPTPKTVAAKSPSPKQPAPANNQAATPQTSGAPQAKPAPRQQAATPAQRPATTSDEQPQQVVKPKTKALTSPEDMAGNQQQEINKQAAAAAAVLTPATTPANSPAIDTKVLAAVLGRGDSALKANPTLSFLAGKLEYISPEMIPGIIADSKFITDALSQADINGLLKQPVALGNLLNDLGFAPQQLAGVSDLGIDLQTKIAPSKLLASIGVDPGSVGAELSMLKDNLQLEGMVPYLTRAARLQTPGAPAQPIKPNMQALAQNPLTAAPLKPQRGQAALSATDPFAPAAAPAPLNNEPTQTMPGTMAPINPYAGMTNTATVPATPTVSTPRAPTPTAPNAASAPRIEGVDIKAVSASPGVYQLQYQQFDERFNQLATDRLSFDKPGITNLENVQASAPIASPKAEIPSSKEISDRVDVGMQVPVATDLGLNDSFQQSKTQMTNTNNSIERLFASQLASVSKNNAQGEQSNSEGKPQSEFFGADTFNGDNLKADQPAHLGAAHGASKFQDQLEVKADPLAANKASEHAKNIADLVNQKAQMLTNQGGGSVLLDLGTPETGKLEIALDVTKDGVGMKILTASEQVKDILMGDIPKLRDALNAQNLDLKQVDFGFKRDFHSHQQHQQNQAFQQQQQFNERQRNGFDQFANNAASPFNLNRFQTPINNIRAAAMNMPTHSGNIQVRV